jgi:HK97 family phage portal protein
MIITPSGVTRHVERRSVLSSMYGAAMTDPAAIPPPGMHSQRRAGVPVTMHTALQVDAVMTSLRVISNAVIKLGDARAYTEALDDDNMPYREWLPDQPKILSETWGPKVFQYDGVSRTVFSLGLFSEAFWYVIEWDDMARPGVLEVLNPAIIEFKRDGTIWYGTGRDKVELNPERLINIPFLAMPGAQRGLNAIEYAGVSFALALAAMEYGQRWFAQGASPSYILSTEQKLGPDEITRIAEKFLVEHSGLQAAHLPLVVDSGLKVEKTQSTPDEAQYLKTLEYARRVIAAYFGLPSHLVGGAAADTTWGGTVEQQALQMTAFTISGYTVRLEQAYGSLLATGHKAALDTSVLELRDATSLAKFIQMVRLTGVETPNEIRVGKLRKRPRPGGAELLTPLNSNTSTPVGEVDAEEIADVLGLDVPDDTSTGSSSTTGTTPA